MTVEERPKPPGDWSDRLGRKVSVRFRIHGDPDHPFSEAVGVVASVSSEGGSEIVTIINRRGGAITIPAPDLLAVKLFPL
ncbi:MAG: hypothetical protein QOH48_1899 [Actinomycetota bacterium]|jgi:hypothetical protein|nr:hypothetical protein [Actinomycetota bacterium]